MQIPTVISDMIKQINQSEDEWLIIVKSMHIAGKVIMTEASERGTWPDGSPIELNVTSLTTGKKVTPGKFYSFATNSDDRFAKDHVVRLLALFEPLLDETMKAVGSKPKGKYFSWEKERMPFLQEIQVNGNDIMNSSEKNILAHGKAIRNCYVHNANRINSEWIETLRAIPDFYEPDFTLENAEDNMLIPGGMIHFKKIGDVIVKISNEIEIYLKICLRKK